MIDVLLRPTRRKEPARSTRWLKSVASRRDARPRVGSKPTRSRSRCRAGPTAVLGEIAAAAGTDVAGRFARPPAFGRRRSTAAIRPPRSRGSRGREAGDPDGRLECVLPESRPAAPARERGRGVTSMERRVRALTVEDVLAAPQGGPVQAAARKRGFTVA